MSSHNVGPGGGGAPPPGGGGGGGGGGFPPPDDDGATGAVLATSSAQTSHPDVVMPETYTPPSTSGGAAAPTNPQQITLDQSRTVNARFPSVQGGQASGMSTVGAGELDKNWKSRLANFFEAHKNKVINGAVAFDRRAVVPPPFSSPSHRPARTRQTTCSTACPCRRVVCVVQFADRSLPSGVVSSTCGPRHQQPLDRALPTD